MKKAIKMIAGACAAAVVCAGGLLYYNLSRQNVRHTSATFVMDAVALAADANDEKRRSAEHAAIVLLNLVIFI